MVRGSDGAELGSLFNKMFFGMKTRVPGVRPETSLRLPSGQQIDLLIYGHSLFGR